MRTNRQVNILVLLAMLIGFGFSVASVKDVKAQEVPPTVPPGLYMVEGGEPLEFVCDHYQDVPGTTANEMANVADNIEVWYTQTPQVCVVPYDSPWYEGSLSLSHPQAMIKTAMEVRYQGRILGKVTIFQAVGLYRISYLPPGTYIWYGPDHAESALQPEFWIATGDSNVEKKYQPNWAKFMQLAHALAVQYSLLGESLGVNTAPNYPAVTLLVGQLEANGETISTPVECGKGVAKSVIQLDYPDQATLIESSISMLRTFSHESFHRWLAVNGNQVQLDSGSIFGTLAVPPSPEESLAEGFAATAMKELATEGTLVSSVFNFALFAGVEKNLLRSYAVRAVRDRAEYIQRLWSFGDITYDYLATPNTRDYLPNLSDFRTGLSQTLNGCTLSPYTASWLSAAGKGSVTYDDLLRGQTQACLYRDVFARMNPTDRNNVAQLSASCKELQVRTELSYESSLVFEYQCFWYQPVNFVFSDYFVDNIAGSGEVWGLPNNQLTDLNGRTLVDDLVTVENKVVICAFAGESSRYRFEKIPLPVNYTHKFFLPLVTR